MTSIPASWMPAAKMSRVHIHWTAGTHNASENDRKHYHVLWNGDGEAVRGVPSIKLNEAPAKKGYAAHTLGANSGAIGVSMCCMAGAKERPFSSGKYPMTEAQWAAMIDGVAQLAKRYGLPVTPATILTHAEVQPNLGIKQRGKWDITRISFDPSVVGYKAVGDKLRREVAATLDGQIPPRPATPPDSLRIRVYRVVGVAPSTLNWRDGPGGRVVSSVPEGTLLEKIDESGGWWRVRSPMGYHGWVWCSFLKEIA
ncbi:MAG TPA: N-acetylmuramoyl-L-alanine amidase [Phycisphaerae bacterium]|nr:N-acetylmuramoyl-L-alanine amidase [Phycisphaerae bacterium]